MLSNIPTEIFNIGEAVFWLACALLVWTLVRKPRGAFCVWRKFTAWNLLLFGVSDILQAIYGSFLNPGMEWLFIWKLINIVGLVASLGWYLKLRIAK